MNLHLFRIRSHREGLYTFIGITLGSVAFGLWQRSVWAGVFIAAVEYGIHVEALRSKEKTNVKVSS